jgi:hypothetical protein
LVNASARLFASKSFGADPGLKAMNQRIGAVDYCSTDRFASLALKSDGKRTVRIHQRGAARVFAHS